MNEDIPKESINEQRSRKKIAVSILFILGIIFSYPTIFPFGLACAAILIFQKNKRAVILGFILIMIQIIFLLSFLLMKMI